MKNNNPVKSPEPWLEALDQFADELIALTGNDASYLEWFRGYAPLHHQQLCVDFFVTVQSAIGVLPLPAFRTLLKILFATHEHILTLYGIREELGTIERAAAVSMMPPHGGKPN